jgi:hypothetical protein
LVTMLLSAYLNRYTLHLNIRSNQIAHTDPSTAALGEATFGAPGKIALILLYSTFGFLCCVSYVDASADAVAGLLELVVGSAPPTMPTLVGCWAVLLLPTTLLRSLKAVALLSFVAFLGGIVMLIAVTLYCLSELLDKGFPSVADLAWVAPSLGDFGQAYVPPASAPAPARTSTSCHPDLLVTSLPSFCCAPHPPHIHVAGSPSCSSSSRSRPAGGWC